MAVRLLWCSGGKLALFSFWCALHLLVLDGDAIGSEKTLDLPQITVSVSDEPSPGYIFLSNFAFSPSIQYTPYLLILDNSGRIVFFREMLSRCHDFKMQPNGLLTYYDTRRRCFVALNSSFHEVDTFACGNGFTTDEHELRILPNRHALLMSYDHKTVRMDTIVPGGKPNATVIGLIIQELDEAKRVVFQWRSWDHFRITDATHEDLTSNVIDYVHGNALELDNDGHLLLSSRHLDEITKINRQTGEIIWRWGGKNNQFEFLNDTLGFSHQHAPRRLPNGNILLFDNGNFHPQPFSRAVEYRLDERLKTAERVWEYRDPSGTYGFAMGYAQRLATGNTLICWGSTNPTLTEVRPNGEKALELSLPAGMFSYRAYRFDFTLSTVKTEPAIQATFTLSQNFPNPFNPSTSIPFHLSTTAHVELSFYDLLGKEVDKLLPGIRSAGAHSIQWSPSSIASGIYSYRLFIDGKAVAARKMLLLR